MFRVKFIYILFLIFLFPCFGSANNNFSHFEKEIEDASREKDYAFHLVPKFHDILCRKGYAPSLDFNYIKWKYKNAIRRYPDNPFLSFYLGELYRYKNKYDEAFNCYDDAIEKAGTNVYKHTILLELFSQKQLWQFQVKEEERFSELKRDLGALSLPILSKYFFIRSLNSGEKSLEENEIERSIRIAKELNPYALEIRLFYVRYLLAHRRFEFFDEFISLIHTLFLDFNTRLFLIRFSYNFLFIFLSMILVGFVLAFFIKYFPFVVTKLVNLFPHDISMPLRYFLSIILLIIPLFWTFPSIYVILYLLIVPMAFLERKEKWSVQIFILLLLMLSLLGGFQMKAFSAMDPSQNIQVFDRVQKSRFESVKIKECDRLMANTNDKFSAYFLKGLQLKRGGFFEEAELNYRKAIEDKSNFCQSYNNLANVLFWEEEIDSSIKYYDLAIACEPNATAPHYNIAQSYIRKLEFDRSSYHMKISARLHFDQITNHMKHSKEINNHFLLDMLLPQQVFWEQFFSLKGDRNILPWKYLGFGWRTLSIILFCCFFLLIIIPRDDKGIKNRCPICSSPISNATSKVFEKENICWKCYRKLSTIDSVDIRERLKDKIVIDRAVISAYTTIFWGLFIPGLGHLRIGKIRTGLLYMLCFTFLCTIVLINRFTVGITYLPFTKGTNLLSITIISLIVLLYLFSLLNLFGKGSEKR